MSNPREVHLSGGVYRDNGEPWIVSFWYIPGGWDYVRAEACTAFFEHEEAARQFTNKNEMLPEMASLMTREQYEAVKAAVSATQY